VASGDASVMEYAQVLWDYHNTETPLENADIIVGLGSYDLRVADRCAELYAAGLAPLVMFTGASGNWTRDRFAGSEARAFAERAVAQGVSPEAIRLEEKATNIGENIALVRAELPDAQRIVWVTKPQTRRRLSATLQVTWPGIMSMITAPRHALVEQAVEGHSLDAVIAEMVGDTWRMAAYPDKGFQSPQPMGLDVQEAFDTLVAIGFTGHLPATVRSLLDR
jgi:uncharacterized SAM-binding protein YcdF (DUF218 family)